ncbi:MAG: glycosyltransferase family 4 protein [Planctomycetota bacterium]
MRILHISTRLIVGGSQENTLLSCVGSANQGHQVALAYGPIYGPEGSLLPRAQADGRLACFEVPDLVRQVSPLRDLRCFRQLTQLIRDWKPDVVHTHSSKAGILGRAAAWRLRVPAVVHTVHGLPFHRFQSRLVHRAYVLAERFAARRCHAIVSVADSMTQQSLAEGIGSPSQYSTIRSGLDTAPFLNAHLLRAAERDRLGIGANTTVIATLGRLAELKGHDDLITAVLPLLRARGRDTLMLLWIGDGWWRKRLEQRLEYEGIRDRVIFTGLVPPDQVPALLAASDVVVHPSWREGLPRAVVQALLCARPVIAADIDGASEVCKAGETGWLVPVGDPLRLRAAIEQVTADPSHAARLAARGQSEVRSEFDGQAMVGRLLSLYRQLLEGPPTRGAPLVR